MGPLPISHLPKGIYHETEPTYVERSFRHCSNHVDPQLLSTVTAMLQLGFTKTLAKPAEHMYTGCFHRCTGHCIPTIQRENIVLNHQNLLTQAYVLPAHVQIFLSVYLWGKDAYLVVHWCVYFFLPNGKNSLLKSAVRASSCVHSL